MLISVGYVSYMYPNKLMENISTRNYMTTLRKPVFST